MTESAIPAPLGLIPRYIRDEHRMAEIDQAMLRYAIAQKKIPIEWHEERTELVVRLNAFYNRPKRAEKNRYIARSIPHPFETDLPLAPPEGRDVCSYCGCVRISAIHEEKTND